MKSPYELHCLTMEQNKGMGVWLSYINPSHSPPLEKCRPDIIPSNTYLNSIFSQSFKHLIMYYEVILHSQIK